MKTFIEYLMEDKDIAAAIRATLKKEFGLTTRDVAVRSSGGTSVRVVAKSVKTLEHLGEIKKIAMQGNKIDRDGPSDEILSGGNTYVFFDIDDALKAKVVEGIKAVVDKAIDSGKAEKNKINITKSVYVTAEKDGTYVVVVDSKAAGRHVVKAEIPRDQIARTIYDAIVFESAFDVVKEFKIK